MMAGPNFCLQELNMEFDPNPDEDNLYECVVHPNGCFNLPFQSDLYFGPRHYDLPESCFDFNCESDKGRKKAKRIGGHMQEFADLDAAKTFLKDHYPGGADDSWTYAYYKFTDDDSDPGITICVLIEPMPHNKYFGIEVPCFSGGEQPVPKDADIRELSSGSLEIRYRDGNHRKALIWRK
jgi:hypothetical protein